MRCEYLSNPLAIAVAQPRLSWKLNAADTQSRNLSQSSYHIQVSSESSFSAADLWDSGEVKSAATSQLEYKGKALASRQQAFWRVRNCDQAGEWSEWSKPATWTMGLLDRNDWLGDWISDADDHVAWTSKNIQNMAKDPVRGKLKLRSASQFRREFNVRGPIKKATLYATALGIYQAQINGKLAGKVLLAPGWTDYNKRIHYQTYDVTSSVKVGQNAIAGELADGWYSGYVAYGLLTGQYGLDPETPGRSYYGLVPAIRMQVDIEYADGTREVIATDRTWKAHQSPAIEADILMGETYDARLEKAGWSAVGFDDSAWKNASVRASTSAVIEPHPCEPVVAIEEIKSKSVKEHTPGVFIFDLGQNISGVVRLKVKGKAGDEVKLRFAEILHADGRLSTENLRCARATDVYILKGNPKGEEWTPSFTSHGFQYVEISGYPGKPGLDAITGIVMHSDVNYHSHFSCSDPMLNQFYQNVIWTQRANFFEMPTDCPQRDERMGWTGDAQVYVNAATYNADIAAFYTKWLRDLNDNQWHHGAYPHFAPMPFSRPNELHAAAWMDAGVLCPWTIWKVYGDTRIVREHWQKMNKFMDFRLARDNKFQGTEEGDSNFGDWLAPVPTPVPFIDLVYHARCCTAMAEMATGLGDANAAKKYADRFNKIKNSFAETYLNSDSTLKIQTQTAYAVALFFDLIPEANKKAAAAHLAKLVQSNGNKLATGFIGTRPLLPALSANGHHDLAGVLMQQKEYPSWGYEVENGANTVWERWNSYVKGEGVHEPSMNSFSHYSFGAVCEWMMGTLLGISSNKNGFDQISIRPQPTGTITQASGDFLTRHGKVACSWDISKSFTTKITMPVNTTALIAIPANLAKSLIDASTKQTVKTELVNGFHQFTIGSGSYEFTAIP